jgi:hypothetical protein
LTHGGIPSVALGKILAMRQQRDPGTVMIGEAAEIMGVSKDRARQLLDPDTGHSLAPAPVSVTVQGRSWLRADIERFDLVRGKKGGRPARNVDDAAKSVKVSE